MLSYRDKQNIMNEFPFIELSYEKKIYKKVHQSDICLVIPKGKKKFAWFRQYKNNFVCFVMELENNKKIKDITILPCCFKPEICVGTILYGTTFSYEGNNFFAIEDIYHFNNKPTSLFSQLQKFKIIQHILTYYLKQICLSNTNMVFGLPLIESNYYRILDKLNNVAYIPYCIQHRWFHKKRSYVNQIIQQKQFAIFQVQPTICTDIYNIYCVDDKKMIFKYGIANIPDYKTSVMMNNLFREIKENKNLDALEESDDEDEFQNIELDKYVYLERVFNMTCVYNKKYNRWIPLKVEDRKSISYKRDIIQMEKK
jgi:hypothetical protein